jgi:hypothetical protein
MEEDGWSVAMARLIPLQQGLERKSRVLLRQGSISLQQIKWLKILVGTCDKDLQCVLVTYGLIQQILTINARKSILQPFN